MQLIDIGGVRALFEMFNRDHEAVRQFLLKYYSTKEGRAKLDNSPHRGRPVEAFVDELLALPQWNNA